MSEISKNIRTAMFFANMNYADLAAATGISPATLQRYGSGKTEKIPVDRLQTIAAVLHVSVNDLVNGKQSDSQLTKETAPTGTADERDLELMSLLPQLTPEQKEMLLLQIKGLLRGQE